MTRSLTLKLAAAAALLAAAGPASALTLAGPVAATGSGIEQARVVSRKVVRGPRCKTVVIKRRGPMGRTKVVRKKRCL